MEPSFFRPPLGAHEPELAEDSSGMPTPSWTTGYILGPGFCPSAPPPGSPVSSLPEANLNSSDTPALP